MNTEMLQAFAAFWGPVLIVGYFIMKALEDRNYSESFQQILIVSAIVCCALLSRKTGVPVNPQSNYIDLISNGFAVSIGSAVVGYVTALLLIGIAKLLGFAEIKAGVREIDTNNKTTEPAEENPLVADERTPQGNPEGGSIIDSSGFFWGLLRYISFIVFFIFIFMLTSFFGIEGSPRDPDWGVGTPKHVWLLLFCTGWGININIYRLLAHIIRWLRSL